MSSGLTQCAGETDENNRVATQHCAEDDQKQQHEANVAKMVYKKQMQLLVADESKKKNRPGEDIGMVTAFQETQMLKSEVILHEAARKNNSDVVRRLVAARVNVNCTNNLDRTPLQWAAANGSKEVMTILLEHGADMEAPDKYGMRPLLWASWFGHVNALKFLVACGADASCVNKQGLGMLHCAANQNQVDVISFIFDQLENYNLTDVDKQGRTAVHLAAKEGHIECLQKLLEKVNSIDAKDKYGKTALHLASTGGHVGCVAKLLEVGFDIDDRDEEGKTALHLSAETGHTEVADYLLKFRADANAETLEEKKRRQDKAEESTDKIAQAPNDNISPDDSVAGCDSVDGLDDKKEKALAASTTALAAPAAEKSVSNSKLLSWFARLWTTKPGPTAADTTLDKARETVATDAVESNPHDPGGVSRSVAAATETNDATNSASISKSTFGALVVSVNDNIIDNTKTEPEKIKLKPFSLKVGNSISLNRKESIL